MAQYNKGIETKKLILKTARHLFFAQGFTATTTRQIAEVSGTNLGLIKYHFESKTDMALMIYLELRTAFDDFVTGFGYPNELRVLIASAVEFIICFNSPSFNRFYTEIYREPQTKELFRGRFQRSTELPDLPEGGLSPEMIFTSLEAGALKPSLIAYHSTPSGGQIPDSEYIRYYMRQQIHLHHFEGGPQLEETAFNELQKFYFNVVDNFTPIMIRIAE